MKCFRLFFCSAIGTIVAGTTGCNMLQGGKLDLGTAIGAGSDLYKAATLNEEQVQSMALQASKELDQTNSVAKSGKYVARLGKITSKLKSYDGLKLEYKVYNSLEINAFALANGSIRVYTGLMDKMTDDEILFVIGHEIGHVKHGHSKEKVRLAYGASAARKGVASSNSMAGAVAASELGGFTEALINSQFSQSEELESDKYGHEILKKMGKPAKAGPSALRKLAELGGDHGFLSSHPDPEDRAKKLEQY
jgi:metalloprotease